MWIQRCHIHIIEIAWQKQTDTSIDPALFTKSIGSHTFHIEDQDPLHAIEDAAHALFFDGIDGTLTSNLRNWNRTGNCRNCRNDNKQDKWLTQGKDDW